MKYLLKFIFPFLRSGVEDKRGVEFCHSRKWGSECLNTRFPLPTLQCAGYSVKMIYFYLFYGVKGWHLIYNVVVVDSTFEVNNKFSLIGESFLTAFLYNAEFHHSTNTISIRLDRILSSSLCRGAGTQACSKFNLAISYQQAPNQI